ncbi:hypothetical protein MXB_1031 [Myxobolus squamalis]|nr:hypothetical protein MXB_1031 [Myxobolus squamalis]
MSRVSASDIADILQLRSLSFKEIFIFSFVEFRSELTVFSYFSVSSEHRLLRPSIQLFIF